MFKMKKYIQTMILLFVVVLFAGCSLGNTVADEVKDAFEKNNVKGLYEKYIKVDDAKKDEYRAAYRELLKREIQETLADDKKGNFSEEKFAKKWERIKNWAWLAEENPGRKFETEKIVAVQVRKFESLRSKFENQYCSVMRKQDSSLSKAVYVNKFLVRQLNNEKGVFYACDYYYSSFLEENIPNIERGECTLDFNDSGISSIRPGRGEFWTIKTGNITLSDARGFSYEVPNYKILSKEKAELAEKMVHAREIGDAMKAQLTREANHLESSLSWITTTEVKAKEPDKVKNGQDSIEKKAEDDLTKRGFKTNIVATTFGMSQDGYLAVDNSTGTKIYVVDSKNNQVATANSRKQLSNYNVGLIENSSGSVIVDFVIFNAPAGDDDQYGAREGNNHIMPVFCAYKIENGEIVPGKLSSGKGKKPKHLQGYLYEAKHVDLINMYLIQSMSLVNEAKKKSLSL